MRRRWHVIADLIKSHDLRVGAEIGVAQGRFAAALLDSCPDLELWAIDSYAPGYKTWHGAEWGCEQQGVNKIAFCKVLSRFPGRLRFMELPSLMAAACLSGALLDFVFIDADHSYDAVVADIAAWKPCIKSGGWLTGHDFDNYKFPGVVQAVRENVKDYIVGDDFVWMARI